MHIVSSSNYSDLNKIVTLRTGGRRKNIDFGGNCHTNFRVICPFCLYKIFQCWINQENLSPVLKLVMTAKQKLNSSIQFFIDARGLLLMGRKGILYAQLKFACVLNRTLFSHAKYP